MKKYLSKLLGFGIILYIVLFLVDFGYSSIVKNATWTPIEAWKDVVKGSIHSEVVIVGSSRAWVQMDPRIIDSILCVNSWNLGMDGSPINRQVKKYELFRKRNSKPKLIIQSIDVWSLDYVVGYLKEQFYPFFWDRDMRKLFFRSEPFTFGEKYIPFFRYHGLDPIYYLFNRTPQLYKGYQGKNKKWNGEAFKRQKTIAFHVSDTTLCLFDSFLKQAKEENITVLFVYAPMYSGVIEKMRNIDQMQKTYKDLADKYDIPILDYTDMWLCRDTSYFYNAMHLNKTGAEIFTDSLANDIKRLGIL